MARDRAENLLHRANRILLLQLPQLQIDRRERLYCIYLRFKALHLLYDIFARAPSIGPDDLADRVIRRLAEEISAEREIAFSLEMVLPVLAQSAELRSCIPGLFRGDLERAVADRLKDREAETGRLVALRERDEPLLAQITEHREDIAALYDLALTRSAGGDRHEAEKLFLHIIRLQDGIVQLRQKLLVPLEASWEDTIGPE
jgi:hypothetical protein